MKAAGCSAGQLRFAGFDVIALLQVNYSIKHDTNIVSFFVDESETDYDEINPVLVAILFNNSYYMSLYLQYYCLFLRTIFEPSTAEHPSSRFAAMLNFISP